MALKTIIAAGLAAVTLAFMPASQAEAKTKIVVGIGTPGFGYGYGYGNNYCYNHPRRCGGWVPRANYYYTPIIPRARYYYDDYRYDHVPARRQLSCSAARNIVDRSGFNKVNTSECRGQVYTFRASKKGHRYVVKVNAFTGRIVGTGRI